MRTVRRPLCLACMLFVLCLYIFTGPPQPSWDVDGAKGMTVTVLGTVADRQIKNDSYQVFLEDVTFVFSGSSGGAALFPKGSTGLVAGLSDTDSGRQYVRIGSRIEIRGVFEPFEVPACEGQFDSRTYYMIRGYEGRLKRARILGVSKGYGVIFESLRRCRERALEVLEENMSGEDVGLVAAMTLGDKGELDSGIKELYQLAGISHVLALSGLHIASVGLALLAFLKKTGIPLKISAVISGSVIGVYAILTGLSVSTVRAMLMFILSVTALMIGRTYDLLTAAAASAILILIERPYYIYDTGFLLSFGAIVGITCIYPVLVRIPSVFCQKSGDKKEGRTLKMLTGLYRSVCVTVSVSIATLPVMGDSFMQISLLAVAVNLIVIPLMGLVLMTGFAGIIIGCLGIKPTVILKITHYILLLYNVLADKSSKIPGNIVLIGQPSQKRMITYVAIMVIAIVTANFSKPKRINNDIHATKKTGVNRTGRHNYINNNCYRTDPENKITYIIESTRDRRKIRRISGLKLTAFMTLTVIATTILMYRSRDDLEIRNVDVGQGDCALIWGADVPAIMIDGGSSSIKEVGKYRIVPVLKANRIGAVDCCFLTHMDSDHVSGVLEMLEDDMCFIGIRKIVISDVSLQADPGNENLRRLLAAAKKRGTEVVTISGGDRIRTGLVNITCLNPPRNISQAAFDPNDASIVLRFEHAGGRDFSAIFTGDISKETERSIAESVSDCVYLKVAHHGSKTSSSDDFLRKAHPEVSVISVGEGNSYGHPAQEVLARLEQNGSRIYRTDKDGEVILSFDDGEVSVFVLKGISYYNDS